MDTGYVHLLTREQRLKILDLMPAAANGRRFITGAFVEGETGDLISLYTREEPSEFAMTSLVRLYLLTVETGKLTPEREAAIKDAFLNWKFWLDEPSTPYVEKWTENHQILNHSIEYLEGQTFTDEVFTNNGQKSDQVKWLGL